MKIPLEKEKATPSSTLAWRIPWTISPWGHKESDMTKQLPLLGSFNRMMKDSQLKVEEPEFEPSQFDPKAEIWTFISVFSLSDLQERVRK